MDKADIIEILKNNNCQQDGLIATLTAIQDKYGYLPETALRTISEQTGRPLIDIYSVASFYNAFSFTPQGKHVIQVCLGTACHVRGAPRVLAETKRKLKIEPDNTTEDQLFTLKTVNCLGACALGPIVVVDDNYHGNTRAQKINAILNLYRNLDDNGKNEND